MFDKLLAGLANVFTKEANRLLDSTDELAYNDELYDEIIYNADLQVQERAARLLDHRDRELLGVAVPDEYDALIK